MRPGLVSSLLAAVLVAACSGHRIDTAAATAALQARFDAVEAAEAAQNTEAALAFWADSGVVQPAGAPQIQGREAIRKLYDSFFGSGQLRKFESSLSQLQVSQSGDLGYGSGVNRMVLAGPKGDLLDVGKFLIVWRRINGEWYIVALSFTSDTPAPTPVQSN